ncbi:MAG: hypothetical protein ACRC6L_03485 [Steroidobacteraceae bacterium]
MEFTLLGTVAALGASFVVVATLVLFTLHAVEAWRPGSRKIDVSRKAGGAVSFRLHHSPQIRQVEAGAPDEEPTRRAA